MNITSLAYLASLLLPATALAETLPPAPPSQSSDTTILDDHGTLRQHSIYTGIRLAFDMQNMIDQAVASSLTDRTAILHSLLKNIDQPEENAELRAAREALDKEYTAVLDRTQLEYDKTFMKENAKEPGVVSLPIGIQYKAILDPDGNNRRIETMDSVERTSTLGRAFGGISGSPGCAGRYLPPILSQTSALQNMPKGRAWILYIPVRLLPTNLRTQIEPSASVLVYTIRNEPGKNEKPTAILPLLPSHGTAPHIPAELRRRYGEMQGAISASLVREALKEYPAKDIDPALARTAFLAHIEKTIDADSLDNEYKNVILRYEEIHKKREKEREARFIKDHARKPGVTVLANGIQYTVEKDPGGRNVDISELKTARLSTISGSDNLTIEGVDLEDFFGDEAGNLPPGRKWTACIPFRILEESQQSTLKAVWEQQPEYIVFTGEAETPEPETQDTDADIEDETAPHAPARPSTRQQPALDAKTLARDEAEFIRLNALNPNTVTLANGAQYSYITDPEGNNGSLDDVHTMQAKTLTDNLLGVMGHFKKNASVAKAYLHPELWPHIDEMPKAKKWYFYIPAHLINPRQLNQYTQELGVRPNYVLYILEAKTEPEQ